MKYNLTVMFIFGVPSSCHVRQLLVIAPHHHADLETLKLVKWISLSDFKLFIRELFRYKCHFCQKKKSDKNEQSTSIFKVTTDHLKKYFKKCPQFPLPLTKSKVTLVKSFFFSSSTMGYKNYLWILLALHKSANGYLKNAYVWIESG